ncbi:MAG: carboxypeptidase regulatory-like domain-containing protein, partial [Nitrosopumilus sp.]|nr:carboxypeptidase regulatory-like domain-containing protein [Nitrosopumilus sp.]
MYKSRLGVIGLFSFLMLFSVVSTSHAELWELVIDVNVEKAAIYSGDSVIVTGKVVDHAYKPIRGAEVFIKAGSYNTKAFTDPWGVFRGEIKDFERIPGTYIVNVIGSWYGMTGLSSTEFQVKGEVSQVSALQQKLSTDEARKYLSSNESDFVKNPIGQTLFKYYHKLLDELISEQKIAQKPSEDKIFIEQQRLIAENLRNQAIEEYKPGAGTYGGLQYNDYSNSLNPEIKDLVISQLNFT